MNGGMFFVLHLSSFILAFSLLRSKGLFGGGRCHCVAGATGIPRGN
jgi:hypothetical protein